MFLGLTGFGLLIFLACAGAGLYEYLSNKNSDED